MSIPTINSAGQSQRDSYQEVCSTVLRQPWPGTWSVRCPATGKASRSLAARQAVEEPIRGVSWLWLLVPIGALPWFTAPPVGTRISIKSGTDISILCLLHETHFELHVGVLHVIRRTFERLFKAATRSTLVAQMFTINATIDR